METLKELNNTVIEINKATIKLYKLMNKPIPEYLRQLAKEIDNQEKR
jgi:hypothetical protein